MSWLITTYVALGLWAEWAWLKMRCVVNRPVIFEDWPNYEQCKFCGKRHN